MAIHGMRMDGRDWSILLVLSVIWGGSFFFIEIAILSVGPLTLVLIRVAIAAAFLWLWLLVRRERLAMPPGAAFAFLALALFCTSIAYILYFRLLASGGATNSLLVTFLIPITAILLGALLLGERPEPRHMLGMALIAAGLAAIDGRLLSRRRPQPVA